MIMNDKDINVMLAGLAMINSRKPKLRANATVGYGEIDIEKWKQPGYRQMVYCWGISRGAVLGNFRMGAEDGSV